MMAVFRLTGTLPFWRKINYLSYYTNYGVTMKFYQG